VATQKIKYSAICLFVLSVATTLVGGYLVFVFGVFGALAGLILGQLIYLLGLVVCFRKLDIRLSAPVVARLKMVISGTLPYAILGVIGLVYFRVDTLLLSYLSTPASVGIYAAGFRFLEGLVFIPSAVATALFPVLAQIDDPAQIRQIYKRAVGWLLLISLPIALGFGLVLPTVIRVLLPEYLESIVVVQLLALAIPFMFAHIPGSLVLISHQKFLKPVIVASIFTLSFNLILNLIFIPRYSYLASTIITVLSEVLSFVVFFGLLWWKVLRK
jgi:O-antigen/teichoic acid export membrane protein